MTHIVDGIRISKQASRRKTCHKWNCDKPATYYVVEQYSPPHGVRRVLSAYCQADARDFAVFKPAIGRLQYKAIPRRKLDDPEEPQG